MEKFISNSVNETEMLAEKLVNRFGAGTIFAMFGSMGMGKTAFVRGLAKGLNLDDRVSSPTFAIVHDYSGKLIHFDMYRINDWDELYCTGFFEYIESGAVIAIEWSENIESALPENCIKVYFEQGDNFDQRIIMLITQGDND